VALDNRINNELSPHHSTAIYPKPDHALYCVLASKRKAWLIPLPCLHGEFSFSPSLFQVGALYHHLLAISIT
jgi:hypothetical protein